MNIKAPFAGSATEPALPTTPGRFDAGNRGQNGPAVPVLATAFARFNAPCSPFMPAFSPSATAPATADERRYLASGSDQHRSDTINKYYDPLSKKYGIHLQK
jgi:hypothetical protein